jgi:hypothetical protein
MFASKNGHSGFVKMLVDLKADVNARDKGRMDSTDHC